MLETDAIYFFSNDLLSFRLRLGKCQDSSFYRSEVLGRLLSSVGEVEVRTIIHRQPSLLDLEIQNGLVSSGSSILF